MALAALLIGWLVLRLFGFGDPESEAVPLVPQPRRETLLRPTALAPSAFRPASGAKLPRVGPFRLTRAQARQAGPRAAGTGTLPGTARRSIAERAPGLPDPAGAVPVGPPARLGVQSLPDAGVGPGALAEPRPGPPSRWSGDAWLLGRNGPGGAPGGAFYGASQLGAVVRYRLDGASAHRPTVYLRGAIALAVAPGQDLAAGIALRPLVRVPVTIGVEARAMRSRQAIRLRPAVVAVSALPPQRLPLDFVADLYAQAGWIGGPEPQVFGDLQARAERIVVDARDWRGRAGAGLWMAGQRGADRLDLGPVVSVVGPFGPHASVRLELDWRLRAAGNAAPGSGLALIAAASF